MLAQVRTGTSCKEVLQSKATFIDLNNMHLQQTQKLESRTCNACSIILYTPMPGCFSYLRDIGALKGYGTYPLLATLT